MKKRWISLLLAVLLLVPVLPSAEAIVLEEGEHVFWIERIQLDLTLPAVVLTFYDWLEAEGAKGADGALADPSNATWFAEYECYGYELAVLENETPVTYSTSFGKGGRMKAAQQAVQEYMETSGMQAHMDAIVEYALAATHAYNRDHPESFWITGGTGIMLPVSYTYPSEGTVNFTQRILICFYKEDAGIDIRSPDYRDSENIREDILRLDDAAEAILSGMPDGTRREQLAYLNHWLITHNSYRSGEIDSSARNPLTALLGSTEENGPVCEGYARAMKILCDRAGIPCVLVNGDAYYEEGGDSIPHMWNSVQMEDGRWYGLDVTWNDPVMLDENGQRIPGAESGYEDEGYFLVGADTETDGLRFADSHVVINDVTENSLHFLNGPALSAEAYPEYAVRVETDGETNYYKTGTEAFAAADGETARITLLSTASLTQPLIPKAGTDWILDLNGCRILGYTQNSEFLFALGENVTLFVCDSVGGGKIVTSGKLFSAAGGTVRLKMKP